MPLFDLVPDNKEFFVGIEVELVAQDAITGRDAGFDLLPGIFADDQIAGHA
jgi:hypothetical protein